MKIERIAIPLLIILIGAGLFLYHQPQPKKLHTYYINGRVYYFMHSLSDVRGIPAYPNETAIRKFFDNGENFTIMFDPSNLDDNGLFAKEGHNIVSRIFHYYGDRGILKRFDAVPGDVQTGNYTIRLIGPHEASDTGIYVENHSLTISGKTPEEFSEAAEKVSYIVLGLYQNSSSQAPEAQQ